MGQLELVGSAEKENEDTQGIVNVETFVQAEKQKKTEPITEGLSVNAVTQAAASLTENTESIKAGSCIH